MTYRSPSPRRFRSARRAFTVLEVMVALGILAILLVIIVLPLRLAFDTLNVGNARALTQSSLDSTVTQIANDLRQAVYVFPNARVPGITNKAPYNDVPPYYLSTDATDTAEPGKGTVTNPSGVTCNTTAKHWSNPSRLDMIQVRRDASGNIISPLAPSYNIVTYYARRQELTKPYDPVDNPIVMYRAEYPAFGLVGTGRTPMPLEVQTPAGALNARIDFPRVDAASTICAGANAPVVNRTGYWLSHNVYGEANLLPLTNPASLSNFADLSSTYSHTLAIPRGLALQATNGYRVSNGKFSPVAPAADNEPEAPLVPDTAFTPTDTNGDGKIDRVTISLRLASFQVGAQGELKNNQPVGTVLPATRSVDLPNIQ